MGGWFEFVGTAWLIAKITSSTAWLSYIAAAQLTPTLILGLFAGIVADRVNRKKLLLTTQFAMMLIAAGFSVVASVDLSDESIKWSLLALSLLQGLAVAFNIPAQQVLTPRLVPREELVAAITLQGICFNTTRAIGPALAGVIMGKWGAGVLIAINAMSFVLVFLAVLTTPDAPAPAREGSLFDIQDFKRDTMEAVRFVWCNRGPRAALLAVVVFSLLATPVLRFLPLFVKDVYHLQEKAFGVLTGIMGAGAVAGGLSMRLVPKWYPKHHVIPFSIFLGGFWILLFALVDSPYLAGGFMFFVGFFWMWSFNTSMAAMHMLVTDSMRGRILSVVNSASIGLMPLGAFIASASGESAAALIHHVRPTWWYEGLDAQLGCGFVAFVLMCAGIVMVIHRTPEIDNIMPGDPRYNRSKNFWHGLTASFHRPSSQSSV